MGQRTIAPIRYSNILTGLDLSGLLKARMRITSDAVKRTPAQSGSEGKSRMRAMAEPSISARSVLMMAISERA